MLNFLRKLRQKNIKTGKYFKYAFGEIVLVVIGILIALQINNWNEDRKNSIIENDYYCQLLEDLSTDINRLEVLKSRAEEVQIKGNRFLRDLDGQTKSKDYLLNLYIEVFRSDDFIPSQIAFQDLLSSGNLNLLKNKALKKQIILYYKDVEALAGKIAANNKSVLEKNAQLSSIDYGWHEMKYLGLESDIMRLLPINNWHLDKTSDNYKTIQDIVVQTLGSNIRKIELIQLINQRLQAPLKALKAECHAE